MLFFVSSCASYQTHQDTPSETKNSSGKNTKQVVSVKAKKAKSVGVWDVLNRKKISLYFTSIDNGSNLTVILEKGINLKAIPRGHWELTSFSVNGKTYNSMNTTKKFVFRMNPTNTYAGSVVVGCPTISTNSYNYLKNMKFFNRYPFTSKQGLCEIVVGNDFAKALNSLRKVRKNKNLRLEMGF